MLAVNNELGYVLAFPASSRLAENSDRLLANLRANTREPQNKLGAVVANDFADEVLAAMISNYLDPDRASKVNIAVMNQLIKLIKKSVHMLINKVVAKLNNDQLLPLADYIAETRIEMESESGMQTYIVCPLSDEHVSLFHSIEDKVAQGEQDKQVADVGEFIDAMSKASIVHFFKKPTALMQLGRVSRTIVDTSYMAVKKGTAAAIRSLVKNMNGQDVVHFLEDTRHKIVKVA